MSYQQIINDLINKGQASLSSLSPVNADNFLGGAVGGIDYTGLDTSQKYQLVSGDTVLADLDFGRDNPLSYRDESRIVDMFDNAGEIIPPEIQKALGQDPADRDIDNLNDVFKVLPDVGIRVTPSVTENVEKAKEIATSETGKKIGISVIGGIATAAVLGLLAYLGLRGRS